MSEKAWVHRRWMGGDAGTDDREPDVDLEPGADEEPSFGWSKEKAARGCYPVSYRWLTPG
jgi:hypothetical protein